MHARSTFAIWKDTIVTHRRYYYIFFKIIKCFENCATIAYVVIFFFFVSNNDNIKHDTNRRLPLQSRGDHEKNVRFIFWRCAIKYTINAFVSVFFSFMSTRNIFIRTRVRTAYVTSNYDNEIVNNFSYL